MIRRLLETLIIECYETHKIESQIKDSAGNYLFMKDLVAKILAKPAWTLGRSARSVLPKLKDLGDKAAFKAGNAYLLFIDMAYQTMIAHPEILSGVFDKEEFQKDYALLSALRPIFNQINELAEGIQKTFMAVGSDAMIAALDVYSSVKQNKDKVPGLSVTADQMSEFFKRTRTKSDTTAK